MSRRVCLHVGSPKSGTTYLQHVLEQNRAALADAGILVAGKNRLQLVHAAMCVREDPQLAHLPAAAARAWDDLCAEIAAWPGELAIVSYELFSAASAEQAAAAIARLAPAEVDVVVTGRDLGRSVVSAWQERLKFGHTETLEEWRPPAEGNAQAHWGWRTLDPAGVAGRWGSALPPERTHVVVVPRGRRDPSLLWDHFAAACRIPVTGLDLSLPPLNESLAPAEAEVQRRVNALVAADVKGAREHAVWLRDTLAHGVLAQQGAGRLSPTPAQLTAARERAEAAITAITTAGYDVRGDLEDLLPADTETARPVPDAAVLESAVQAVAGLLLAFKESGARPIPGPNAGAAGTSAAVPGRDRVRGGVRALAGPMLDRRLADLEGQVRALEAQVREQRRLHQRVAALQDLVSELLLPSEVADAEVGFKALREYRRGAL